MKCEGERIVLKGRKVIGGLAEGEALVSTVPLMGWGCLDEKRGIITERGHPLYEVPFKGKVLVFTEPRGSGGFNAYGSTRRFNTHPAAFIYRGGLSLTVLAAMVMKVPTVTDFDRDPTTVIETGDYVYVNGDEGILEIIKAGGRV